MGECIENVRWIDCWCPDAAQFILLDASADLSASNSAGLRETIGASHLGERIRLVCGANTLADDGLVEALDHHGVGVLLHVDPATMVDVQWLAGSGILGLRLAGGAISAEGRSEAALSMRRLVRDAHEMGMRVVVSQLPDAVSEIGLFAAGIDYVSRPGAGFGPAEADHLFKRARVGSSRVLPPAE